MKTISVILAFAVFGSISGCGDATAPEADGSASNGLSTQLPAADSVYVGSAACGECHQQQFSDWSESHHDLALQPATPDTVLANFSGSHNGATFARVDDRFLITPEPDQPASEVLYTFGVMPLQQYIIADADGRMQTFPIAWDTRDKAAGGQRWFDLYPENYPAGDPMHWTGRANRWNSQCADCHSTAVQKRYDEQSRSYDTTFAEEDVGCEACHGPGSLHAEAPATETLHDLSVQENQIDSCAPCHSRRSQLAEGFTPGRNFLDFYSPRIVSPGYYHVDGQVLEEVYVYGSFLQSKMHRAGVTCSNCHDPHSAEVTLTGNDTCTQCHQPSGRQEFSTLAGGIYDEPSHHFHSPGSTGAQCVSCHMPSTTYMGVDDRRDHSFRIPRPDLSESLGVPNPCTSCHQDQTNTWAAKAILEHVGAEPPPHFAATFSEADRQAPEAEAALAEMVADSSQPVMIRAAALARMSGYRRGYTLDSIRLARNSDPLLRLAAPLASYGLSAENRWRLIAPLLEDELLAVRHQAYSTLLPLALQNPDYRTRLEQDFESWRQDQSINLDYPETQTNLAGAYMALTDIAAAESALLEALALQPSWVPALLNLADVYRFTDRESDAQGLLQKALLVAPEQAETHYAYALWLSRTEQSASALEYFQRAALLAPDQIAYGYALALALNDNGDGAGAVQVLEALLVDREDDQQLLIAAVTMLRDQQRYAEALAWLDRLEVLRPADQQLSELRQSLLEK